MLMTYHAQKQRAKRLTYMWDNFASETLVLETPSRFEGYTMQIYHTGMTFIVANDIGELITAYMITPEMARVTFRKAHTPLSDNLIKRITKNYKQYCEFEKARK